MNAATSISATRRTKTFTKRDMTTPYKEIHLCSGYQFFVSPQPEDAGIKNPRKLSADLFQT
jgi:hypothetical protein